MKDAVAHAAADPRRNGLVQAAPGVWIDPVVRADIHPHRCRFLLLDDRGYEQLGLSKEQRNSIYRLAEAGFIRIHRILPRRGLLNLDSWEAHLHASADDPFYWEDERRLARFRGTYAGNAERS